MSKSINDLRDAMFETLADLRAGKITIEQAKAVSDVGQVIINSAKVEVDYIKANPGAGGTKFLEAPKEPEALPPGVTGITRHRLAG